jgi:hypothetical protein
MVGSLIVCALCIHKFPTTAVLATGADFEKAAEIAIKQAHENKVPDTY